MKKTKPDQYSSGNLILNQKDDIGSLVLGDCNSAVDLHLLKPHKIQTIFTFGQDGVPQKKDKNIDYKFYAIMDNKTQKICDVMDEVFLEIQSSRKQGGVLLHCYTGISRSPSFAIGYLMRKKAMSYDTARKLIKKQRPVIHPNDNFHRQLQEYQKILIKRRELQKQSLKQQNVKEEEGLSSTSKNILSTSSFSRINKGVPGGVKSAYPSKKGNQIDLVNNSPSTISTLLQKVEEEKHQEKNNFK